MMSAHLAMVVFFSFPLLVGQVGERAAGMQTSHQKGCAAAWALSIRAVLGGAGAQ